MSSQVTAGIAPCSAGVARRLCSAVSRAAARPDVRAAVEANHDDNRWWPASVRDWRVRMAVAGWSSRVSYAMVSTYAGVVSQADRLGWLGLSSLDDASLVRLLRPIGLPAARIRYLRSLDSFIGDAEAKGADLATPPHGDLIAALAERVDGAGFNTAQCAVLYARGYHCGVIPVDSGMVRNLAPLLGIELPPGQAAYEQLRKLLEACVTASPDWYRAAASDHGYRIQIPDHAAPTWFVHLVLIYLKRLYLNRPTPELCPRRPACPELFGCRCQPEGTIR